MALAVTEDIPSLSIAETVTLIFTFLPSFMAEDLRIVIAGPRFDAPPPPPGVPLSPSGAGNAVNELELTIAPGGLAAELLPENSRVTILLTFPSVIGFKSESIAGIFGIVTEEIPASDPSDAGLKS